MFSFLDTEEGNCWVTCSGFVMACWRFSWLARAGPVLRDSAGWGVSRVSSISGLHGAWASCPVSEPWPPHLPIRDNPPELLGADVK